MTKRYELVVSNIGKIDTYDSKEEAIKEALAYHKGEHGGRGWKEPCYIFDKQANQIVFEVEPHDEPAEGE